MKLKHQNIICQLSGSPSIEILNYKSDYVGIKTAKSNGFYYIGDHLYITYEGGSVGKEIGTECKLICRPLSDLTKEIEVNGEKLKVCDILQAKLNYGFAGIYPTTEKQISEKIRTNTLFYSDAVKLFKFHFDVFGLIEKGLAIDINTLK